jgi:octaprenyl-diphosphate synthase
MPKSVVFLQLPIVMKLDLKHIQVPIESEMTQFEHKFRDFMKSKVKLLDHITHYIVKRKGKQMRPMFVFLTAGVCGTINESTHRGAALIELLHTASLVHDDVVDDANYRRGFFSINALWKNKIAVLVGDYLLSRGLYPMLYAKCLKGNCCKVTRRENWTWKRTSITKLSGKKPPV